MRLIIMVVLGYLMSNAALAQNASYTGQQARDIKALSSQEQADLLSGRGMGLARAGELNHYPGPAHALELQGQLGLSPAQVATLRSSFERMATPARPLGAELVYRERALDAAFVAGSITPDSLAQQTAAIAELQGRLRAVHLAAHLETRSVLTPMQVTRYDELRGYVGNGRPAPDLPGDRHNGHNHQPG